ncbi:MAG: flagellar filament capping protein FliD [Bdellovibrionota bacterium]
MAISFGGMASGLPPNIVEQLIDAEKIPIQTIQGKKSKVENKLKLVDDLATKVSDIQNSIGGLASARGFTDIKLESADPSIIGGTVDPNSVRTGNWAIEVLQLAQKAAAITNGFPDKNETQIGVGYFSFQTADGEKEVYISGENSTLEGAANAINRAGVGLQATIINDQTDPDAPYRLMLTAKDVGKENQVDYPTLYFLDGDQDVFFEQSREAKNGKIKLDGFEIDVQDNVLDDLLPGVTLELKQASPGKTISLNVKEDMEVVSGKVKSFVDSINSVLGFIQQQNSLTQESDTSATLGGDVVLRTIESRVRQLLQSQVLGTGSNIRTLNEIGITFTRGGTLEYSEEKFNTKLKQNPEQVQKFLAGDGFNTGFIPKLRNMIRTLNDSSFGPLNNRRRGLQQQIEQMDNRLESLERRITQKEQNLRRKFAALEEKMAGIQAQGQFLAGSVAGGAG